MEIINTYIWQDQHDSDQYHFGVKAKSKHLPNRYYMYGTVFTDGMRDCLGFTDDEIDAIGSTPVQIDIKFKIGGSFDENNLGN